MAVIDVANHRSGSTKTVQHVAQGKQKLAPTPSKINGQFNQTWEQIIRKDGLKRAGPHSPRFAQDIPLRIHEYATIKNKIKRQNYLIVLSNNCVPLISPALASFTSSVCMPELAKCNGAKFVLSALVENAFAGAIVKQAPKAEKAHKPSL
jgi:hypothetical protein